MKLIIELFVVLESLECNFADASACKGGKSGCIYQGEVIQKTCHSYTNGNGIRVNQIHELTNPVHFVVSDKEFELLGC